MGSEPPAGGSGRVAYPSAGHAPTPTHPLTYTLHTVDINTLRLSSFGKKVEQRYFRLVVDTAENVPRRLATSASAILTWRLGGRISVLHNCMEYSSNYM